MGTCANCVENFGRRYRLPTRVVSAEFAFVQVTDNTGLAWRRAVNDAALRVDGSRLNPVLRNAWIAVASGRTEAAMKSWNTREARIVLDWIALPAEHRPRIERLAANLGRSTGSVERFIRRNVPEADWPWVRRRRWGPDEIAAVERGTKKLPSRSAVAVKKFVSRNCRPRWDGAELEEDDGWTKLTVSQVARDLGVSRASVYRMLDRGLLRRFKGGVAESSFQALLREHPERVPYARLPLKSREWLVLNGYADPGLVVKRPSTKGLLD